MVIWLVTRNGKSLRLFDPWHPSIYAWTKDSIALPPFLTSRQFAIEHTVEYKYVSPSDFERTKVLRLTFQRSSDIKSYLQRINPMQLINARFFNVDVPVAQLYLYEKDLFPLAFVQAQVNGNGIEWKLLDDCYSCQYETPPLKGASISLQIRKSGKIPTFHDPIESITVEASGSSLRIDAGSEVEKLLELTKMVRETDPDIVLTKNGDSFLFPYLIQRASEHQVLHKLILDREGRHLQPARKQGKSYFSYGRIYYKPSPVHLLGRLHLDIFNDFISEDCGLQGLFEITRTCRTPLNRASRETIGTNMTSLQMYQAYRRDILIPWKKNEPENFKTACELLKADRGGFILEPKVGLFDNVGEIDFTSLYPTLMMKHNLTPECIACECCAYTDDAKYVPELNYNLCEKKIGIVPHTLQILLQKRAEYKTLLSKISNPSLRSTYDQRQAALKWILVCSFGYLGYKNARFGKIDAHIAVCAFARKVLRETLEIAQEHGFSVIHGIVDSLWLKKERADEEDYVNLCSTIEQRVNLPISFEGIYRWIVFLPSKVYTDLPVLNRYYGAFRSGKIKIRGLEYRRRDTPPIIKNCQHDVINHLALARNAAEFYIRLPSAFSIVQGYMSKLIESRVDLQDLLITKQLSKNPEEYRHRVTQAIAAKQLVREGVQVSAGQNVSYILQRNHGAAENSVLPSELIDGHMEYDVQKYEKLLLDATAALFSPLGYSRERVNELFNRGRSR